jgi:hypothetical protein
MKKIIAIAVLSSISATCFASRVLSYSGLQTALSFGDQIKNIVIDQSKCSGAPYQVKALFTPHAFMVLSNSILTSDSVVTDLDPTNPKQLTREQVDYTIVPNGQTVGTYTCATTNGCLVMNSNVYSMKDSSFTGSYPQVNCPLGSAVVMYADSSNK